MFHKKIHATIKKHAPQVYHSSRKKFHFRYPRMIILVLCIILAYLLFSNPFIFSYISRLEYANTYLCSFIAGILLAFGFSSALGVGLFVTLQPQNIFLATFLGGLGAMFADLILFKMIKNSFVEEFRELKKKGVMGKIEKIMNNHKHVLFKHYLLYAVAGIIIATPLADEAGVSMLAGLTTIKQNVLLVMSFVIHTFFVLLLLWVF